MKANEAATSAAEWGGEGPNIANFWGIARDHFLGSTHLRDSVTSEFRENNLWRVGYESQRNRENAAEWGGEAPNFANFWKMAENISEENNLWSTLR